MLFYRVEMADGMGPYRMSVVNPAMSSAHTDMDHPTPWNEAKLGFRLDDEEVCGFTALVDAKRWFRGWGPDLAARGFELNVYEVDAFAVREGDYQSVIDRARLTNKLRTLDVQYL